MDQRGDRGKGLKDEKGLEVVLCANERHGCERREINAK